MQRIWAANLRTAHVAQSRHAQKTVSVRGTLLSMLALGLEQPP